MTAKDLSNVYDDAVRASAYSQLEFRGTYYLASRDIPEILDRHVTGTRALDFGCGAGRSTRLLQELGFDVIGVDISPQMLESARRIDPHGDYRLIPDGDLSSLEPNSFDLIQTLYAFDAISSREKKVSMFRALGNLLKPQGRIVILVAAPDIYVNEWLSFTTKDFPENRRARSGDTVRIVVKDMPDQRPVDDVLCSEEDYREIFTESGLETIETWWPKGKDSDPYDWISETEVSPWAIHVLRRKDSNRCPPE